MHATINVQITASAEAEKGNRLRDPSHLGRNVIYHALRNSKARYPYPLKWPSFRKSK